MIKVGQVWVAKDGSIITIVGATDSDFYYQAAMAPTPSFHLINQPSLKPYLTLAGNYPKSIRLKQYLRIMKKRWVHSTSLTAWVITEDRPDGVYCVWSSITPGLEDPNIYDALREAGYALDEAFTVATILSNYGIEIQ